jgi:hypothetical protein
MKDFLRPNKRKVLISILLIGISGFLTFVPPLPYIILPFHFPMLLFYNIPNYLTIVIFVLVSYPFGCYIAKSKKWVKGFFLYLATFIAVSAAIVFSISFYNENFGRSCSRDSECKFICGAGAVNNKFIYLKDPFLIMDCRFMVAICENNRCETFAPEDANSTENCERITEMYGKSLCYYSLARKLNDKSLCINIQEANLKENCIKQFEK